MHLWCATRVADIPLATCHACASSHPREPSHPPQAPQGPDEKKQVGQRGGQETHTQLGCGAQRMILLERTLMGVLHCPLGEPCSLGACVSNVLTCVVVIARCRISLRPSACNHKAQAHHCWQRARGCRGARDCSRDHVGRWRRWCCRNPD